MKDLLRTAELTPEDLRLLLRLSRELERDPALHRAALANQTAVLFFEKPSTRTRISMGTAVARLGGIPLFVGPSELQLGRGETIEDTARVISRYARLFAVRTGPDEDVRRFARAATIPVVNALTRRHHPCQSLADLLTLEEHCGPVDALKIAWVGDATNVCHSLVEGVCMLGGHVSVASPEGYGPDPGVVGVARDLGALSGGSLRLVEDPVEAVEGADAVFTDVWMSMGTPEAERAARIRALTPYRVDGALMARAGAEARFLHCLPDHRGEEVTAEVVDGPRSVVFDQAENRLHTATALFLALLQGRLEGRAP